VWDAESQSLYNTLPGKYATLSDQTGTMYGVAWPHAGTYYVAAGYADGTARIWEASVSYERRVLRGHKGAVQAVAWSHDDKRLGTGGADGTVGIWEVDGGRHVYTLAGHTDAVRAMAWSPDGKHLATGSSDGTVRIWVEE
jgi:WD40 repeat protein